jgi:hypothetical protein
MSCPILIYITIDTFSDRSQIPRPSADMHPYTHQQQEARLTTNNNHLLLVVLAPSLLPLSPPFRTIYPPFINRIVATSIRIDTVSSLPLFACYLPCLWCQNNNTRTSSTTTKAHFRHFSFFSFLLRHFAPHPDSFRLRFELIRWVIAFVRFFCLLILLVFTNEIHINKKNNNTVFDCCVFLHCYHPLLPSAPSSNHSPRLLSTGGSPPLFDSLLYLSC